MIATVELFPNEILARDPQKLKDMFRPRGDAVVNTPGLILKAWYNNPQLGRFGGFLLWESEAALREFRKGNDSSVLKERWGVEPTVEDFDVYQLVQNGTITRF